MTERIIMVRATNNATILKRIDFKKIPFYKNGAFAPLID